MQPSKAAIDEYLAAEKAANATKEGADLNAIAAEVAARHNTTAKALLDAVIEYDMPGAF